MSEFYSGMPGPQAIDKLNSLWALSSSVGSAAAEVAAAAASAASAASAATTAASAATTAAAVYDDFDDRYLGPKGQAPSVDNDGNPLVTGALYFNTSSDVMHVRTASATWVPLADSASQIAAAAQATAASTQATNSSNSATAASTQATNSSNSATAAAAQATAASTQTTNSSNSATAAAAQATAAASQATTASTQATNAAISAIEADDYASTAYQYATNANNSATAAASQAATASAAATTATTKASEALTSANNASVIESQAASSATSALGYKNLAADWAEKLTEVEPGKYSAKYWAGQAAATITGQLIYRGQWSAASGIYPSTPVLGDYYKISVAGTISGTVFAVSDSIIYNGSAWDKIDNTEPVASVAGKVGEVTLVRADVGLGNVDNTSDASKPVSTLTQAALDLKADLASPILTGNVIIAGGQQLTRTAMGANNISLSAANFFTKTISGNTTFTVSNTPSTGTTASFILELTNAGSATITWWSGMKWAGGIAPTLTSAGVDILGFYTHDGGTNWRGLVLAKDSK